MSGFTGQPPSPSDDFAAGSGRAVGVRSPGDSSSPPILPGSGSAAPTGLGSVAPSGLVGVAPSGVGSERPRAQFDAGELAMVCSRYDVGVIEAVKEFRRGSSRAPKVALKTNQGTFLLKRRTAAAAQAPRVALSHAVQAHLAARGFPLPKLRATRTDGRTALELGGSVYELFEFVAGNIYDQSLDATGDAGRVLATFHRLLAGFDTRTHHPPSGTFHNARGLPEQLARIGDRIPEPGAATLTDRLAAMFAVAAERVERLGMATWPVQLIHGDWHPGNMVYRGSRVVAVIDYDTVRLAPRAADIANGALQFSITRLAENPESWPAGLDEGRFKRFCRGYDMVKGCVISTAELEALPWLMVEAIIVEAVAPIAATGSFAGLRASPFLKMVDAKAAWLAEHADRLTALAAD
ncbi:MAG: phosphotransferase enzyme family protein [Phycisphaerales bacterium]